MDEHRQNAYRYLLYQAMLDIRPIVGTRASWNPWRRRQQDRVIDFAGELAYAMHNLALYAAKNFVGFDEAAFWSGIERLATNFPDRQPWRYRTIFDDALCGHAHMLFG